MKRRTTVLSLGLCISAFGLGTSVSEATDGRKESKKDALIYGFNPPAAVVVGQPIASGIGGGFGGGSGGFGGFFNNFGHPLGFIAAVDTNFVAVFPDQFGTNFVVLPFAATNLTSFAGRIPLGPLAPPIPPTPGNAAPGAAPAVPPQDPFVEFPQPNITPVVPPSGQLPPVGQPFPPTGRPFAPPVAPKPAPPPK